MTALYVVSTETYSGKTAMCICLARQFQRDGFSVGYMKPVSSGARLTGGSQDEDAVFFKQAFDLPDALHDMAPIVLGPQLTDRILRGDDSTSLADRLRSAYLHVAQGRAIVVLEGGSNLREGTLIGLPPSEVAKVLQARALVVAKYNDDVQLLDDALAGKAIFGESFSGLVLNSIPRQTLPFVQETVRPALESRGVPVLAVLPQERLLQAISVGELAEFLSGEMLCGQDKADELVEHLMVGAMGVESALNYFRRKPNKAVITGGDRSDIQLAALETSTKCLILTGGLRPSQIIQSRAQEVGIPMILVRHDTLAAVETIERFFGKTRFHQQKKTVRFDEMLADRFDFDRLYAAIGLHKHA